MGRQVIALSVAILLAFAFCCGVSLADELPRVTTSPFSDVPDDHPNARDFALLQVLGIFEGYGDGRVEPDEPLERAQFAKVAVCLLNRGDQVEATNDRTPDFLDVDQIAPVWWGWINVAHSTGLIRGYEDGTFRHSAKITLAEAATVLLRVAGYDPFLEGLSYPDDYVALAEELGLTRGVELEPYVPVTRAEMAAMAVNALQLNPPDASGLPAADRISGYRENLLESRDERLEGFVSDVTPDELTIDGRPHPIASTVYLFGADSLEPLPGQWVVAYERPSGEVGFVEAAAGSTRLAGVLEDVDTESFRLRVGDRW
ncbi:MAG: S-layer homology domain-containing protein, partial [Bacillota bacterium]